MWLNLKEVVNKNKYLLIFIALALVSAILFSIYYFKTETNFNWQSNVEHISSPRTHRLLDGRRVAEEKSALKPIIVMMENHSKSRPTTGLEYASIIYETVIEGDITRFLAIFDPEIRAKKIGPVRSVRPFFVEIAEEYNSVIFHAGGSEDAMFKLTYSRVQNVNEISSDGIYFWRDHNREMPHNLFTSINQIQRAIEAKEINIEADFEPWLFKKENPSQPDYPDYPTGEKWENVHSIKVNFNNNPLYQVEYRYNEENNDYTRYLAGVTHKTELGIILKAKNIVLQHVNFDIVDDYGRLDVNVTGKGHAEIYKDGRMTEAYWIKAKNGRTRFYDLGNREIQFNAGTIWVELVFNR